MLTKVTSLVSEANITVENRTDIYIDLNQIVRLVNFCRQQLRLRIGIAVDVTFVTEATMADLHVRYMGLSAATDVLSLPTLDISKGPVNPRNLKDESILGDIVICPAFIERNTPSGSAQMSVDACVIHAMLHLIGYDHLELQDQRNMFSLEHLISSSWVKSRAKRGQFALAGKP